MDLVWRGQEYSGMGLVSRKYWSRACKVVLVHMQDRGFNSFASNMIKLSVNETKWSSLLARTYALILYISIWIFDVGPEKLPWLSRNGPLDRWANMFHVHKRRPCSISIIVILTGGPPVLPCKKRSKNRIYIYLQWNSVGSAPLPAVAVVK